MHGFFCDQAADGHGQELDDKGGSHPGGIAQGQIGQAGAQSGSGGCLFAAQQPGGQEDHHIAQVGVAGTQGDFEGECEYKHQCGHHGGKGDVTDIDFFRLLHTKSPFLVRCVYFTARVSSFQYTKYRKIPCTVGAGLTLAARCATIPGQTDVMYNIVINKRRRGYGAKERPV